eukprot:jgi/Chlat1/1395/Chrsp12S01969
MNGRVHKKPLRSPISILCKPRASSAVPPPAYATLGFAALSASETLPLPLESNAAVWAALTACAALGHVAERWTKGQVSSTVATLGCASLLASTSILPSSSPVYSFVWAWVVPAATALALLETDLRDAAAAGSTLFAFIIGAIGTILGTVVSFAIIGPHLGAEGWKVAACLCASYIGGSINYAATAQQPTFPSSSSPAMAMGAPSKEAHMQTVAASATEKQPAAPEERLTGESLTVALATAAMVCALAQGTCVLLRPVVQGAELAVTAVLASAASMLTASFEKGNGGENAGLIGVKSFRGAGLLGVACQSIFFAVVGATASVGEAILGGWPMLLFIALQLTVHLVVTLGVSKVFKLPMPAVLVASNANVGGPATAAAMATARGWPNLVQPALLTGTLGYTVGTGLGIAVGRLLM